jgi:methyl-accepting chemotaxis protein
MEKTLNLSATPTWLRLTIAVWLMLAIALGGMIFWETKVSRDTSIEQAGDFANSIHEMTMAGLTSMMLTGTVGQRELFLDQIKELSILKDLQVVRGTGVSSQYGDGGRPAPVLDSAEKEVLASNKELIRVEQDAEHGHFLRVIKPVLASKNYLGKDCTLCHTVPEGSQLGLVSMKVSLDKVDATVNAFMWKSLIVAVLFSLPLIAVFGLIVRRYVLRVLGGEPDYAVDITHRVAEGDLSVHIKLQPKDKGSLLFAMQAMIDNLTRIIGDVSSASDKLSNAAGQVSATAQSLSQSSSQQAASVEETTSSIEQMTNSITQNTENAKVTDEMAAKAAMEAAEGGEAVNKTVNDMKSIASKIGIVDDIAYQTNLLALNAAIEAARAGEHGKGFAVVAAEVRKLAERSQVAAQEIGNLASSSVKQAERAGKLLMEVVPTIRQTSELVQEIAITSQKQSAGVGQINGSMGQLNQATQQNASASEELAATAAELGEQAQELQQIMTFFQLDDSQQKPNK